ncbi:MAG TPA: hypothetical protein VNX28_13600, partial [Gemmataceae bacterium]|nr:hypothetical protein [Gemmataceae bacterium]
ANLNGFLAVRLAGDLIEETDEHGEPIIGETLLILLNAHHEKIAFTLPATKVEHRWERLLDTAEPQGEALFFTEKEVYPLQERSLALLRIRVVDESPADMTAIQTGTLLKEIQRLPAHSDRPALGAIP